MSWKNLDIRLQFVLSANCQDTSRQIWGPFQKGLIFLLENRFQDFFYWKAKIDHLLKCPTESNYIEKWKNCTIKNHVTPSYETDNHSCIIGSIAEKIIFQVSFKNKIYVLLVNFDTLHILYFSVNYSFSKLQQSIIFREIIRLPERWGWFQMLW